MLEARLHVCKSFYNLLALSESFPQKSDLQSSLHVPLKLHNSEAVIEKLQLG